MTSLADLSLDALGRILDFLDSQSLFRVLSSGDNTYMRNKIYASARQIHHTFRYTARKATCPNFSAFLALETVYIAAIDPDRRYSAAAVYNIDLLSLPPTLRKLKLHFLNDILCLIDLPPTTYNGGHFTPRLRLGLKQKFKNLESISFTSSPPDWDLSLLVEDFVRWPLVMDNWSDFLPAVSLHRAVQLPEGVLDLPLDLRPKGEDTEGESKTVFRLPSTLVSLALPIKLRAYSPPIMTLKCLFPLLSSQLKHLTSLTATVEEKVDYALIASLPRTLLSLELICWDDTNLDSFGSLPPGLTSLNVAYHGSLSHDPHPNAVQQRLRCDVVEKLPKGLKRISRAAWCLVRPEDWEKFPAKDVSIIPRSTVSVEHADVPYLQHLPTQIRDINISSAICTVPMIVALSSCRHLSRLDFPLLTNELGIGRDDPNFHASASMHITSLLDALSQRAHLLETITVEIDEGFDLFFLQHLIAPNLRYLHFISLWRLADLFSVPRRTRILVAEHAQDVVDEREAPPCFNTLHHLSFDATSWTILHRSLPSMLKACKELQTLRSPPRTEMAFQSAWLPLLPPTLRTLICQLDKVNVDAIKALPKSLRKIESRYTPQEDSNWKLGDLRLLPRSMHMIGLPLPSIPDSRKPLVLIQKEIEDHFDSDVAFCYENGSVPRATVSFLDMIALEHEFRKRSIHLSPSSDDEEPSL